MNIYFYQWRHTIYNSSPAAIPVNLLFSCEESIEHQLRLQWDLVVSPTSSDTISVRHRHRDPSAKLKIIGILPVLLPSEDTFVLRDNLQ